MVRWVDGLYGGLIAGVTSAAFYAVVAVAWLHEATLSEFFAQIARGLPPLHAAPASAGIAALGATVYVVLAAAFGVVYATLARRVRSMWRAPASVVWGIVYGLVVWALINDVLVPLTGAVADEPLWEGLVATVVFYGVVLSELTTMAHRRAASGSP